MNERIDAIYLQVIDETCADPLYRFAELIIQECINCKNPLIKYYIDEHSEQEQVLLLASISDYVSEIQKHFGIDPTIFGNNS
jgi:predicted TIM-barrel fold metal-dependent hydrolase